MSDRLRYALSQGLILAVVMFAFRRLGNLLPIEWMSETWTSSLVLAVAFGLVWAVMSWLLYHRGVKRRAQREQRERGRQ